MATKVSADSVLSDASGIEKVWKANPDIKLGKKDEAVTLDDYSASKKAVSDLNDKVADARIALTGLMDGRDDAALLLSGYNTRALSAFRGIFGPDSAEYDQAGGTRSSERKKPTRTKKDAPK